MRTHFLLYDVGIARLTFQIRPHQYFQCFDLKVCSWDLGHLAKMAATPIYGKNL